MKQVIILFAVLTFSLTINAQATLEAPSPTTEIEFVEDIFNFGVIGNGEVVQNVFEFENTGDEPLIITNAKGSCGCTVPRWPKDPIMPGESASLLVRFDSKSKKGMQSKRISITANTEPVITYLTLKGKVLSKEETELLAADRKKDQEMDASTVSLFPNPSSTVLNVDLSAYKGKAAVLSVFDLQGQLIETKNIQELGENPSFDVTRLSSGVYTLSVKIEGMERLAKQFSVLAM